MQITKSIFHKELILFLLLFFTCSIVYAQEEKKVETTYTFIAPENLSIEQAKAKALERAKIQIIAEEFGTTISQNNTTLMSNSNGKSDVDFMSLSSSDVKGEWIETYGEPTYDISYKNNQLIITVSAKGKIRKIVSADIDVKAKVLRNGTEVKFESSEFKSGDDLYLYFQSPVNTFVAVYLLNQMNNQVYCLLPYQNSSYGVFSAEHDKPYIFFSSTKTEGNPEEVDEYVMTCEEEMERNTIFVIHSVNAFAKASSESTDEKLPRELSFKDFQTWVSKCRSKDVDMKVITIPITITK